MNITVGITGQSGFIGTHFFNFLRTRQGIKRVNFDKSYFDNQKDLCSFVSNCDAIVHLAGMSRGDNQQLVYDTNMLLVEKLLKAAEYAGNKPHILFGSTTHEAKDSLYHKSKRNGRTMIDKWAKENGARSTGLLMPNVFGPYSKPYFNSFVSTFCHKVAIGEKPEIIADSKVELIYIETICRHICGAIASESNNNPMTIPHEFEVSVSEVLNKLMYFRNTLQNKKIPTLDTLFATRLFSTYLSYC
ncbi:MAG: NAD-dependent epimerase/dehydratase family protein [Lentisphaerota bacterium]